MALTLPHPQQSLAATTKESREMGMPAPILLSSASARQYAFTLTAPTQRHHQHSAGPSSSASSTISSTSDMSNSPAGGIHPTGRRILVKFAPLPDPRKLEEDELDSLSPTSDSEEAAYEDVRISGTSVLHRITSASSAATATPNKITTLDADLSGSGVYTGSDSKPQRSSPRWKKRLLGPLLPKISTSNTAGGDSEGASPLFRPSSMDSIRSTQSAAPYLNSSGGTFSTISNFMLGSKNRSASDLEHQRARASSNGSSTSALLAKMSPLTHSISETGASSPLSRTSSNAKNDNAIRRTRSNTSTTAAGANNARRKFMLNGRVYGTKRGGLTPDPFSHQRAYEQEFNEWGSGGLGSVPASRAQGAAADWDRVRHGKTAFTKSTSQATDANGKEKTEVVEDEDDGSGMGWVKRRREARERAKAEEEAARAKELKEKEAASAAVSDHHANGQVATGPSPTDNPATAEDPPGTDASAAAASTVDGNADPEHIPRPHSSATIRDSHPTTSSIPQIVVHDAHSTPGEELTHENTITTSSSQPAPSAPSPAHHDTTPAHHPQPTPAVDPHAPEKVAEHMMEMTVVPPRPSHRRSDSTRRAGHSQSPPQSQAHHRNDKLDGSSDGNGTDVDEPVKTKGHTKAAGAQTYECRKAEEKDEVSTLRQRPSSPPPVHRMDSGKSSNSSGSTSSTSSERSMEDDDDERDDDDDDDMDDEDEAETQRRLTAECAGVEKVSRHREQKS